VSLPSAPLFSGRAKLDRVVEELSGIDTTARFLVDNSAGADQAVGAGSLPRMIPLKKKWCSHNPSRQRQVLEDLAAQAGAWYVYQAIFGHFGLQSAAASPAITPTARREGTILLASTTRPRTTSSVWWIFLLEIELDLAESPF